MSTSPTLASDFFFAACFTVGWATAFATIKHVVLNIPFVKNTICRNFKSANRHTFSVFATSTIHSVLASLNGALMFYDVFYSSSKENSGDVFIHPRFRFHMLADFAYYLVDTYAEAAGSSGDGSSSDESENKASSSHARMLKKLFLLHHFPLVAGYVFYIPWTYSQTPQVAASTSVLMSMLYTVHASTPLQNFRWFLDKTAAAADDEEEHTNNKATTTTTTTDKTNSKINIPKSLVYKINFALFLVLFFTQRIYGMYPAIRSLIWMKHLPSDTSFVDLVTVHLPLKCAVGTGLLYVLNVLWFVQNLRKARTIFFSSSRRAPSSEAKKKTN